MFTLILNSDYRINLVFFIPCLHKHPISLNPLTSQSDQDRISPWSNIKFSKLTSQEPYGRQ